MIRIPASLLRFVVVGGVGFVVDAGVLTALVRLEWGLLVARLVSFALAVTATWLLNRLWTFRAHRSARLHREYAHYVLTQSLGAAVNMLVFFALLGLIPVWRTQPIGALACASIVAMGVNYLLSRYWVFRAVEPRQTGERR